MSKQYDLTKIDKQMMIDIDSLVPHGVVWMRNDYLSMRGYSYHDDRPTYDLLEKVALLKEELVKEGHQFNCDKVL